MKMIRAGDRIINPAMIREAFDRGEHDGPAGRARLVEVKVDGESVYWAFYGADADKVWSLLTAEAEDWPTPQKPPRKTLRVH